MILITDQFPLGIRKYVLMGLEECQVHACARLRVCAECVHLCQHAQYGNMCMCACLCVQMQQILEIFSCLCAQIPTLTCVWSSIPVSVCIYICTSLCIHADELFMRPWVLICCYNRLHSAGKAFHKATGVLLRSLMLLARSQRSCLTSWCWKGWRSVRTGQIPPPQNGENHFCVILTGDV